MKIFILGRSFLNGSLQMPWKYTALVNTSFVSESIAPTGTRSVILFSVWSSTQPFIVCRACSVWAKFKPGKFSAIHLTSDAQKLGQKLVAFLSP